MTRRAFPPPKPPALRPRLIIMVKEPVLGRVKTRLAREIGFAAATRFYRNLSKVLLRRLCCGGRWAALLAVTPDQAMHARAWPGSLARMAQGRGDLGARMQHLFERAPPGPAIIIGSDIPAIKPDLIEKAFHALGSHDAVFGPAEDGGYWLVGLKRRPCVPRIFSHVRWSTPHALADTLRNARGLSIAFAATLSDVDNAESRRRLAAAAARLIPPLDLLERDPEKWAPVFR